MRPPESRVAARPLSNCNVAFRSDCRVNSLNQKSLTTASGSIKEIHTGSLFVNSGGEGSEDCSEDCILIGSELCNASLTFMCLFIDIVISMSLILLIDPVLSGFCKP